MSESEKEKKEGCRLELEVDEKGQWWATYVPPAVLPTENHGCICHPDMKFKRRHFSCRMFCRFKRVAQGKMPARIPIIPYTILLHEGWGLPSRKHVKLKSTLLKWVLTIAEWLAN
jgi:hypothetical protein